MPVNTANLGGGGTVIGTGLSIVTEGNSAVSAYGPRLGCDVAVVATTVAAFDSADTTFAVTGAAALDPIIVAAPSSISADLVYTAFVPSAGNVTLRLVNSTLTAIAQTAQTWGIEILRRSAVTRI